MIKHCIIFYYNTHVLFAQNGEVSYPEDEEEEADTEDMEEDGLHVNLPTPPPIVKFEL